MEPDFREALIVTTGLTVLVTAWFRVQSWRSREPLDRRQEGWFILIALRLAAAAYFIGLVAWFVRPQSLAFAELPLPEALRWAAVGLTALAPPFQWWTMRTLGRNLTDTVVTRREHALVTTGPYASVRHPFYLAVGSLMLGNAVGAANGFLLVSAVVFLGLIALRTGKEEANLEARFGDAYREYKARTGRFLPR
jgi:protein-S-isoprenylcysteine O-methyltransferase Ste14